MTFLCLFTYLFHVFILRLYSSYRYGANCASNVSMILLEHAMMVTNTCVWKLLLYGCCSFGFDLSCFFFAVFLLLFFVLCLCLFFVWFIAFVALLRLCLFCFCVIPITETLTTMVSNSVFVLFLYHSYNRNLGDHGK